MMVQMGAQLKRQRFKVDASHASHAYDLLKTIYIATDISIGKCRMETWHLSAHALGVSCRLMRGMRGMGAITMKAMGNIRTLIPAE